MNKRTVGIVVIGLAVGFLATFLVMEGNPFEDEPEAGTSFIDPQFLIDRAADAQAASRGFARQDPALELAEVTLTSQKGWNEVVDAVRVEIAERRAARQAETEVSTSQPTSNSGTTSVGTSRPDLWPGATSVWDSQPDWVVAWAVCNVKLESWYFEPSPYLAENYEGSGASGVGQWMDETWASHVAGSGVAVNSTAHASLNTPEQQDRVLAWAARFAYGAWTHGCPRM